MRRVDRWTGGRVTAAVTGDGSGSGTHPRHDLPARRYLSVIRYATISAICSSVRPPTATMPLVMGSYSPFPIDMHLCAGLHHRRVLDPVREVLRIVGEEVRRRWCSRDATCVRSGPSTPIDGGIAANLVASDACRARINRRATLGVTRGECGIIEAESSRDRRPGHNVIAQALGRKLEAGRWCGSRWWWCRRRLRGCGTGHSLRWHSATRRSSRPPEAELAPRRARTPHVRPDGAPSSRNSQASPCTRESSCSHATCRRTRCSFR